MMTSQTFPCPRVAIIGAGPAGVAAARYLVAEKFFRLIDVYEQRADFGGLWQYSSTVEGDGFFQVPQTAPNLGHEHPIREGGEIHFLSPLYNQLITNIPRQLMAYSDLSLPECLPLFPSHVHILEYLQTYSKDILPLVKFSTQVRNIELQQTDPADKNSNRDLWKVESTNLRSSETTSVEYDAVIVATGHYSVPYIPDIRGLGAWHSAFPDSIIHSKYYRDPEEFQNARVLVVGAHAAGLDISSQLVPNSEAVYLSQRSRTELLTGFAKPNRVLPKPPISEVDHRGFKVTFEDGSVLGDVDAIIFCTGYLYSFPFLSEPQASIVQDGFMVHGTYEHLFNVDSPTLSFMILPKKIIPFPLAEMQAAVLARVYSGRLSLPSKTDMGGWEASVLSECGSLDQFHTMSYPKDAEYMDMLVDWAATAEKRHNLENAGQGKSARKWSSKERHTRENIVSLRKLFAEKSSVQDLGPKFEETP